MAPAGDDEDAAKQHPAVLCSTHVAVALNKREGYAHALRAYGAGIFLHSKRRFARLAVRMDAFEGKL